MSDNPYIKGFLEIEEARKKSHNNVFTEAKKLTAAQKRIDLNDNGRIDDKDLKTLRDLRNEEAPATQIVPVTTGQGGRYGPRVDTTTVRGVTRASTGGVPFLQDDEGRSLEHTPTTTTTPQPDIPNTNNNLPAGHSDSTGADIDSPFSYPDRPGGPLDGDAAAEPFEMPTIEFDSTPSRTPEAIADVGTTSTNLRVGSSGDDVRDVQSFLGISADGQYGPQTRQAVMDFQRAQGLQVDGIVGDQTMSAIRRQQTMRGRSASGGRSANESVELSAKELAHIASIMEAPNSPGPNVEVGRSSALNSGILRRGSSGDEVRQIQQLLVDRGYDLGPAGVDGQYGPATERAVRDFQTQRGLQVDGQVGRQTFAEFGDRDPISATHLDGVPADLNRTTPPRDVDLGITTANGSSYGTQTVPGDPMGPLTQAGRTADVIDAAAAAISARQAAQETNPDAYTNPNYIRPQRPRGPQ